MAALFVTLYPLLVAVVVLFAGIVWNLRCESFGCIGVGVAWFAWTLGYGVVLSLGVLTLKLFKLEGRWKATRTQLRITKVSLGLQILLGAILLLVWGYKQIGS
jgi:hypothetical protein